MSNAMQDTGGACCHHHKATPRSEQELRLLQNRLKRMMGQLNGISKMLDENRYCGDILIQVAAVESALQSLWLPGAARPPGNLRGGGNPKGQHPDCGRSGGAHQKAEVRSKV